MCIDRNMTDFSTFCRFTFERKLRGIKFEDIDCLTSLFMLGNYSNTIVAYFFVKFSPSVSKMKRIIILNSLSSMNLLFFKMNKYLNLL